eukprot:TRINITY_DN64245_c0_g1_i1.p1 TRINITY_DN64245_c0_g1~~TRINITY_DN64245_c0_g1_i1.p1  ORF type:complete len:262 (+),score=71.69 TRINITY_DN64245_c0_g1_i1:68-787(+)
MSLEKLPQLGSKPVPLTVKLSAANHDDPMALPESLRELYRKGEFADVTLICAGQTFPAHRAVLAARSEVFRRNFAATVPIAQSGPEEVRLADVRNPEAVKYMLDHVYQMEIPPKDPSPHALEITRDVLRLGRDFELPTLTHRAMQWLARDLTTGNVVERLTICDEFALQTLHDKILEQLTLNRQALGEVAGSPQIMQHPKLMQALLQQAAQLPADLNYGSSPPSKATSGAGAPKKKAKR